MQKLKVLLLAVNYLIIDLIFPFKNISTNGLLEFVQNRSKLKIYSQSNIVNQAINNNKAFVDFIITHKTIRGIVKEGVRCYVNKDEKKNFCDCICQNATAEGFKYF